MNTSRVMIPALLAAALIGGTMTSDAFAGPHHRGQGNGYGPCYGYGDGGCWEGGWGHHGHARGWGYRAMSDAQRAKFDKIMEEFAPRMEQLRDSIYVKRQELRALENATRWPTCMTPWATSWLPKWACRKASRMPPAVLVVPVAIAVPPWIAPVATAPAVTPVTTTVPIAATTKS